jgi:hypothetical protein
MANGPRKPMRQGQQNRRGRGRGRKPQNPLSRNLESNGPDVKIRGTASHIAEKYATLARDALSSGDMVAGESYLQHAEHYNRIIMANQAQQAENASVSGVGREQPNGSGEGAENAQPEAASAPQPDIASAPQPEAAPEAAANDKSDEDLDADDGLARTMARTTKSAGNGADKESKADVVDGDEKQGTPDKADAEEAPDEAVT